MHREEGQAIVLVALAMVAMLGMLALAVDGGVAYAMRRQMQNASDSGSLGGAQVLLNRLGDLSAATEQAVLAAVHSNAEQNGVADSNGIPGDGINDNIQAFFVDQFDNPLAAPLGSNGFVPDAARGVQVATSGSFVSFFAGLAGHDSLGVGATAAARYESVVVPFGLLVLHPSECGAMYVHGQGDFSVTNGGVHVNSACTSGQLYTGKTSTTADSLSVVGSYEIQGGNATVTPTPDTGTDPVPDPLANLSDPGWGFPTQHGTPATPQLLDISGPIAVALDPGIYWGGVRIRGQANVDFRPGPYVFAGGGLEISGQGDVTGNGVFFFNTVDPMNPNGDGAFGDFYCAGVGDIEFTPMGSGTYKNLLYFQDRNNTQNVYIAGNCLGGLTGTIYTPNAMIDIAGNGNTEAQFITETIEVRGNGWMDILYDGDRFYEYEVLFLSQ